jgi:hypothetical protein
MIQLPDPELAKEVGVVAWALMFGMVSGVGAVAFFLRRITQAMDRMAVAQEATPLIVSKLEVVFVERTTRLEQKLDKAVDLATEHVRIARLWESTEAAGRSVRPPP